MIRKILSPISRLFLTAITCVALAISTASAASIEVQFQGLDVQYDDSSGTFDIYDATSHDGGNMASAEADDLVDVGFFVDNVMVGSQFISDVYVDLLVSDIIVPVGEGTATSAGNNDSFGLDIWHEGAEPWHLKLNFDEVTVAVAAGDIFISVGGEASSIAGQDLPFDLEIDENFDITVVLSSASVNVVSTSGGNITELNASGVGNIQGTLVPEPSSIILTILSCLGLAFYGFKCRCQSQNK